VVVAPCGFDHPFPPENAALFRSVVRRGGAYLSLVPANIAATPPAFFRRNACLAALCHVLVLVEAPLRSGARNAVKHAKRLGRPVLVVPSPPWNPKGLGCIEELKHGGRPLMGAGDVLSWLKALRLHAVSAPTQLAPRPRAPEPTPKTDPDGDLDAITAALRHGARHANQLCAQTGLPAARVQRALLTLTLQGVLGSDAAGWLKFLSS
jgi:DNA processing protein